MSGMKSWILTDVEERIYVENWNMTAELSGIGKGWSVTKTRLKGGLSDGVDLIEVNNGRLSFTVVPTRGMGFWRGSCDGDFIGWESPARLPVNPAFVNLLEQGGLGWLKGFNECVVRCGLNSNGAPGIDRVRDNNGNIAEVMLNLHGYIANIPAFRVEVQVIPGDPAEIVVIGVMEESRCFCPQYRLTTRYSTLVGSNEFKFKDQVLNFADSPTEFMMLYHCNFGRPYLGSDSKLVCPALEVAPRDPRAAEDIDTWDLYRAPEAGYVEQGNYLDLASRADGSTLAMLRNSAGDKGVVVRWDKTQLPCFCQWKHTAGLNEGYVTGLEPATNYPNPKRFERERGRVVTLQAGQTYTIDMGFQFISDASGVSEIEREVAEVLGGRGTKVYPEAVGKWSQLD
jgi:hypothetical protein